MGTSLAEEQYHLRWNDYHSRYFFLLFRAPSPLFSKMFQISGTTTVKGIFQFFTLILICKNFEYTFSWIRPVDLYALALWQNEAAFCVYLQYSVGFSLHT